MKNTLRITALAAFTLIGTASFGQSLNMNGGFTTSTLRMAGMSNETSSETYNGGTYTSSSKYMNISGFNVGVGYEFILGNRLSLETGVKYQTRGHKMEYGYSFEGSSGNYSEINTVNYKMKYLDLPIVLNTAILTGDFRVYARTGIYAGFMTGAKYSMRREYTSSDGSSELTEYSETVDMDGDDIGERITGGFVLGAGAEYKGFYLEANYNLGAYSLANLDYEVYTHDFSLSLGYKLKFNK
ncbi:MAG: PorT family protein [Crocinitomicaceae bacterium]|nr:PorT family protein [Flavobacteriales bacterium]NQZ38229.1 PorT family protein [Crocinitomicaceae bacterium]